jgi:hypothetical protein
MYKSGAGNLGPGQYNIPRNGIDLKDPLRPSSAFARIGKGKFEGVGGFPFSPTTRASGGRHA